MSLHPTTAADLARATQQDRVRTAAVRRLATEATRCRRRLLRRRPTGCDCPSAR